ncbi:MAG: NAD(P)H-dependent glycerol-3-phosphate dehydrogenase [Rikenellaceae bacterium]
MEINISSSSKCAVIGYGSWATAVIKILCEKEKKVGWHIRNEEVLECVTQEGYNPKYLRDTELEISKLDISNDVNYIVDNYDIIIMAMPSAYIKTFLEPLSISLNDKFIVSAIKGIVPDNYVTVVEYLKVQYELSYKQLGVITGPSHAEEVALERLSYITVVSPDLELAHLLGDKISCKYINVSYSADLYGIEYATILKNIYSIAVGIAIGLGYGDNFVAVLISNCAREMNNYLMESFPDDRETRESAYLGDLLVTCYSLYSRNRRFGLLLGRGFNVKSALNEMTMVAEGYFAAHCIKHLNEIHKVDLPIVDMVYNILYRKLSARKAMRNLTKELK